MAAYCLALSRFRVSPERRFRRYRIPEAILIRLKILRRPRVGRESGRVAGPATARALQVLRTASLLRLRILRSPERSSRPRARKIPYQVRGVPRRVPAEY